MAGRAVRADANERRQLARRLLAQRGIPLRRQDAIPACNTASPPRLSFAQRRIWFLDQMNPGSAFYNTPITVAIKGELDVVALERVLGQLVERHQILRTTFPVIDGEARQLIGSAGNFRLLKTDLRGVPESSREEEAMRLSEQAVREPFDLSVGPLFHGRLLRLHDQEWWLLLLIHHMVFDGWSYWVLAQEMHALYAAAVTGDTQRLPELPVQYADFAEWQHSQAAEQQFSKELSHWIGRMADAPPLLALPTDRPREATQTFVGKTLCFELPQQLIEAATSLSKRSGVTLFVVLLAAFKCLLHRYTEQTDLVVSSGIANRTKRELEPLIGCFINILLLRTDMSGDPTFSELLRRVAASTVEAFANQDVPFDRVVAALQPKRDPSYGPLTQVMIVYHNTARELAHIAGVTFEQIMPERAASQYDVLLHLQPHDGAMRGIFEYNTALFDQETIERLAMHFETILSSAVTGEDIPISALRVMSSEEVADLMALNETASEFPRTSCLHGLIERRVAEQPNEIAVIDTREKVSYSELNSRADRLAARLARLGIGPGSTVGISMERSVDMVVGLLAIAKAGGAYLPLDPKYPAERLRQMVSDAGASLVVTQDKLREQFAAWGDVLAVSDEVPERGDTWPPQRARVRPEDLIYVIFTSGSSGRPKGVMLDHRGRVNNFSDFNRRFKVTRGDRLLAISSLSFDMCAYDVFGVLMAGATIVLPSPDAAIDPVHWADLVARLEVTIWHSAPALLNAFVDCVEIECITRAESLRLVLLGGDWIPLNLPGRIRRLSRPDVQVISLGGATEVSMDSTIFPVSEVDPGWVSIPYGVPMANQKAYVLDSNLQLVPIGISGELYLGGVGVGWGYVHQPALTAERFLPNAFSDQPGDRFYRTGDLARWTNAGQLELLGRADQQVKINGVRVELGEIATTLKRFEGVRDAVAYTTRDEIGEPTLVGYIVSDEGQSVEISSLKEFLRLTLPEYMIPRYYVELKALPLSPNGKINRRALPGIDRAQLERREQSPPNTIFEHELHSIWSDVLGSHEFGVTDNFFEIGGDSFKAIQIIQRYPRKLSILEFLRDPTIAGQGRLMEEPSRPRETSLFQFRKGAEKGQPTLICVPYGGGSPIAFRSLANALPRQIGIRSVILPGHDIGSSAGDLKTLEETADRCVEEINQKLSGELAIYGHCAGSALAVELALRLEEIGRPVRVLFLGAVLPPTPQSAEPPPARTDDEVAAFIQQLGGIEEAADPAHLKFLAQAFRHDAEVAARYVGKMFGRAPRKIAAPIVAIFGRQDPLTSGFDDLWQGWRQLSPHVGIETVPGGHYFVQSQATETAGIIVKHMEARDWNQQCGHAVGAAHG